MVLINTNIRDLGNFSSFYPCTCHETCENVSYIVGLTLADTEENNPEVISCTILCNRCNFSVDVDLRGKNYHKSDLLLPSYLM